MSYIGKSTISNKLCVLKVTLKNIYKDVNN